MNILEPNIDTVAALLAKLTDAQLRKYAALCEADTYQYNDQESFCFGRIALIKRAEA